MHRFVFAALPAQQLVGAIREHLVAIHVVRRAGPRLVGIDDELLAMPAGEHLVRGFHDGVRELGVQAAGFLVRQGRGFLDQDDGIDEGGEGSEVGDREVLPRALGLDAPQRLRGHGHLAQRITLDARLIRLIHRRHHPVSLEPRIAHGIGPR